MEREKEYVERFFDERGSVMPAMRRLRQEGQRQYGAPEMLVRRHRWHGSHITGGYIKSAPEMLARRSVGPPAAACVDRSSDASRPSAAFSSVAEPSTWPSTWPST